ncbi:hypothetical protein ADIS_0121 [Lunatimonas lonarensis]|uniref:DUF4846 domain-containing protein n=1 Tax=Lunatimonas lonarensis TaxID=1232681 RepID=R7ZZB2_9BACT|nr:DUF4846 domain-containing protein [Lunatimonas lonarensis]EON79431.1 hypothetical protein ADIS_0121 [Lunatimonas lonarensis]
MKQLGPSIILCTLTLSLLFTACNGTDASNLLNTEGSTVAERVLVPRGFARESTTSGSWQYYLQHLRLLPHGSKVVDFQGRPISDQRNHVAVMDIDVGSKDLQQCADATIRLRAEYLYERKAFDKIKFQFTSGHNYAWLDHAKGIRPDVKGNKVEFKQTANSDNSYQNFRRYLDIVFMYAGTISLERELTKVNRGGDYQIGDVIVHPCSPGHAVIIVDRAKNSKGKYIYLLAQGYTPAQSIHVVKSHDRGISPWFDLPKKLPIWHERFFFKSPQIRRFS